MSDFPKGLFTKPPHQNAPDFVKAKISIKREELIEWLQQQSGEWVNLDVKEKKDGSGWSTVVDDWKPNSQPAAPKAEEFADGDIPF